MAGGWRSSEEGDLNKLKPYAEAAVKKVLSDSILKKAKLQTRFLTLGVDLNRGRQKQNGHRCKVNCPETCTHAELVAVVDTNSGKVIHWTGKSYPDENQKNTLVHVVDLETHLYEMGSERVLILGCHDLHLLGTRGRKSKNGQSPKEKRSKKMLKLAKKFEPTMILHHPHETHSSYVWAPAWGAEKLKKLKIQTWASGIAFCSYYEDQKPYQTLEAVQDATASDGVHNVEVEGYDQ